MFRSLSSLCSRLWTYIDWRGILVLTGMALREWIITVAVSLLPILFGVFSLSISQEPINLLKAFARNCQRGELLLLSLSVVSPMLHLAGTETHKRLLGRVPYLLVPAVLAGAVAIATVRINENPYSPEALLPWSYGIFGFVSVILLIALFEKHRRFTKAEQRSMEAYKAAKAEDADDKALSTFRQKQESDVESILSNRGEK